MTHDSLHEHTHMKNKIEMQLEVISQLITSIPLKIKQHHIEHNIRIVYSAASNSSEKSKCSNNILLRCYICAWASNKCKHIKELTFFSYLNINTNKFG